MSDLAAWQGPDVVDARGMLCPLPVLRLRKVLMTRAVGARVRLIASDAMAVVDVPHFCAAAGHVVIASCDLGPGLWGFVVQRGLSVPDPREI